MTDAGRRRPCRSRRASASRMFHNIHYANGLMRARPQLADGSARQVQSAINVEDDAGDEAVAVETRDGLGDCVDGCQAEADADERLAASNIPAGLSAHHGLSMTPGETALTRSGASSLARVLARLSSAPLIAAKPEVPGPALREDAAVTKVIDPPSPIWGKADCAACQCTQNLPSKPRRRARASSSAKGPAPLPAEAARIKWSIGATRPKKASSAARSEASNASPAPDGPSDAQGGGELLPVASDDRDAGAPGGEQLRRRQSDSRTCRRR